MARMIPDLTQDQLRGLKSRAEARFYEECRRQLPPDVLVIYSANWIYRDGRGRLLEGEADFTIAVPQSGIFVVEVKGGGVSFDAGTGRWSSLDRNRVEHEIKDPFKQASNERHAIKDQLLCHPSWRRWRGSRLMLGHAVMLPDVQNVRPLFGTDRQQDFIGIDTDMLTLVPWLTRLRAFWWRADDDALGAHGVQLVEEILCSSIKVRPALRSVIDEAEQTRLRLTTNQAKILRIIGSRKRAVISGGAGTGKTLIAVEKARQLAESVENILLLCYNRPLADALAASVADQSRITVLTFHQLCERRVAAARVETARDLLKEAQEAYPGYGDKHLFDVQMPYALALSNELLEEKFDALVVDEAQDFSDDYWFAVEELLRQPSDGPLYIFIDENQALYRRHGNLPVKGEPFHLTANCRNTAPIHRTGYAFYTGVAVDEPDLPGQEVHRVAIEGDVAQANMIANIIKELLSEGVRSEDIAVLLAKRPKATLHALLQANRLPAGTGWSIETAGQRNSVLVDTVSRFKGLESPAVILWLGDETVVAKEWEVVYVGTTRAKSLLYVVGSTRALSAIM